MFTTNVPKWNFMPLTDKKGERIYARLYTEEEFEKEVHLQYHLFSLVMVQYPTILVPGPVPLKSSLVFY